MSETLFFFCVLGLALWLLGLHGLMSMSSLLRRIIAVNIMASGIFMIMVALAGRSDPPDPVLQALVVTGLVVGVSATAFAVRLYRAVQASESAKEGP